MTQKRKDGESVVSSTIQDMPGISRLERVKKEVCELLDDEADL